MIRACKSKAVDPGIFASLMLYNPETGSLHWLPRDASLFQDRQRSREHICNQWNSCWANKPALTCIDANGYLHGTIFSKTQYAHRVIWAIMTGAWPVAHIDHIDGDKSNNRWSNLRAATHSENMKNMKKPSSNKSGVKGVCWDSRNAKWLAQIGANGRNHWLGLFDNINDASAAYSAASKKYHGEFGRTA